MVSREWGERSGETAGLFGRLAIQGLGDVQGSETVTFFVCRGREVFPWVREYCGEGLQSMGPPLISLDWPEGISDSSTLVQQRFVFPFSW